jgi:chitodextrinase
MAKKSRRARRQSRQRSSSPAVAPPQPAAEAVKPQATPGGDQATVTSPARRGQVDFSREYHYVINDLRNMAVIAVAMLAVLIALSFVIR